MTPAKPDEVPFRATRWPFPAIFDVIRGPLRSGALCPKVEQSSYDENHSCIRHLDAPRSPDVAVPHTHTAAFTASRSPRAAFQGQRPKHQGIPAPTPRHGFTIRAITRYCTSNSSRATPNSSPSRTIGAGSMLSWNGAVTVPQYRPAGSNTSSAHCSTP
jgi:hypothetical protein